VAELMISDRSFHDAHGNFLLTAKITHGATLHVPTLAVRSNNRRLISDHRLWLLMCRHVLGPWLRIGN